MDVIHVKNRFLTLLGKSAIFATPGRTEDHLGSQLCRDAHAPLAGATRALNLRRERNSANSTNPSASRLSAAFSGWPPSCLSNRASNRFLTPRGSLNPRIPAGTGTSMVVHFPMAARRKTIPCPMSKSHSSSWRPTYRESEPMSWMASGKSGRSWMARVAASMAACFWP